MPLLLVSFPHDPARSFAAMLRWAGAGFYNWKTYTWNQAFSPSCLLPLSVPAGDVPGDVVSAWAQVPDTRAAETQLRVVALDPQGNPVETAWEEILPVA